jgi:capsule polysaccharide export protein KpsC/LpsZ
MPITHSLLVKIHVSDADNYSPNQLKRLMQLPGVKIVSPFVGSRKFIENADIVLTIQGTIGLEACLLGKPLIIFGDSPIKNFPTATKVNCIEDLPKIIRAKLIEARTTKKAIIESYANFLKNYLPSCSDDWDVTLKKGLSESEIRNFVTIFKKLTQFVINQIR